MKPLLIRLFTLLFALASGTCLALDHPDVPDYRTAFALRALPYQDALEQASSTTALAQAYEAQSRFLDGELNRAYQQLMGQLDADSRRKLVAAQRAWLVHQQAEADFIVTEWMPKRFGSSSTLSRAVYRNALVRARIEVLLGYLQNYPPAANRDKATNP